MTPFHIFFPVGFNGDYLCLGGAAMELGEERLQRCALKSLSLHLNAGHRAGSVT